VGFVGVRGSGPRRIDEVDDNRLKPIRDGARAFEPFWDHQIGRIKERAERKASERDAGRDQPDEEG
jgi:hypothetical protein